MQTVFCSWQKLLRVSLHLFCLKVCLSLNVLASSQDCCQTGRFYGLGLWNRSFGYLSDGHGAEDVEEDEGAVRVVLAQQVAVRQPLDVRQRHKRQLGHHSSIKTGRKRRKAGRSVSLFPEEGSPEYLYVYSGLRFLIKNANIWTKCATYMELNMPIRAVKQKPMANMDFMRTCRHAHLQLMSCVVQVRTRQLDQPLHTNYEALLFLRGMHIAHHFSKTKAFF